MKLTSLCAMLFLFGCESGTPNGTVTGTITLDGQPVAGGLIRFIPINGNSQPDDSPIANGQYSVSTLPGEKRVEILWLKTTDAPPDTTAQGTTRAVQMIPAKYNTQSTLTHTVVKGKATKDFALQTK